MIQRPVRMSTCCSISRFACAGMLLWSIVGAASAQVLPPKYEQPNVPPELTPVARNPRPIEPGEGGKGDSQNQGVAPCVMCQDTEGEPSGGCADNYVDNFNGGCNSTPAVFSPIACGQTVCGQSGTFLSGTSQFRDTDWYRVTITQRTVLTWTVTADFAPLIGFIAQPCPQTAFISSVVGVACQATTLTSACLNPGQYVCFVAPSVFTGVPCGSHYTGTLTCVVCETGACCTANGCQVLTQAACATACGQYKGNSTNCGTPTYVVSACQNPLDDISQTGTVSTVTGTDDNSQNNVPIGFTFPYFGNTFTVCTINNNGFLSMDNTLGSGFFSNVAFPNTALPNNTIAPLWDDLDSRLQGSIRYQTKAAPNRFIVQWTGTQHFSETGGPYTFQAILFQTGDMEYRYGVLNTADGVYSPNVGFENADGTIGTDIPLAMVGNGNSCIHIAAVPGVNPCTCPADVTGNHVVNIDDLLAVIGAWGPCAGCAADCTGNCVVNIDDLLVVIGGWGPCP